MVGGLATLPDFTDTMSSQEARRSHGSWTVHRLEGRSTVPSRTSREQDPLKIIPSKEKSQFPSIPDETPAGAEVGADVAETTTFESSIEQIILSY